VAIDQCSLIFVRTGSGHQNLGCFCPHIWLIDFQEIFKNLSGFSSNFCPHTHQPSDITFTGPPPPRRHLRPFNAATHNAHHPPRWSPTTITRRPTWQCHVTNRTTGHIDARQRRWEPSCHVAVGDVASRRWTTTRSVPPPPYCLLTPEPGVATRRRTIIDHRPISTQHNTMATRAHHHPPRRWPITTPSIGDEDPGPAPPHQRRQWPSTSTTP